MRLVMTTDGVLKRYANQIGALGIDAPKALQRALSHTGNKAKTQVIRALTKQTGLSRKVIVHAVKVKRPSYTDLTYVMTTRGGDISLKYFKARETAKGVSAAPWNSRRIFRSTFMRAGWWPHRVTKPGWNGQVFRRTGGKTSTGQDEFEKVKSGLFIPDEMVKGATEQAWRDVAERDLEARVGHELGRLLP